MTPVSWLKNFMSNSSLQLVFALTSVYFFNLIDAAGSETWIKCLQLSSEEKVGDTKPQKRPISVIDFYSRKVARLNGH